MVLAPAALFTAEGASLDQLTGRLTAFNILDTVLAAGLPSLLHRMAAVCIYESGPEPVAFYERLELQSPSGQGIWKSAIHVQIQAHVAGGGAPAHRTIHGIYNVRLEAVGDYRLVLSHADGPDGPWHEVASRCLSVVRAPHPVFIQTQAPIPQE
jgi:hypothetical protein